MEMLGQFYDNASRQNNLTINLTLSSSEMCQNFFLPDKGVTCHPINDGNPRLPSLVTISS